MVLLFHTTDPGGRAVLMRGCAASLLLGLRVRISPGALMSVSSVCCVLSGTDLYAFDRSLFQRSPTECGVLV
jgi:hypothetical protein